MIVCLDCDTHKLTRVAWGGDGWPFMSTGQLPAPQALHSSLQHPASARSSFQGDPRFGLASPLPLGPLNPPSHLGAAYLQLPPYPGSKSAENGRLPAAPRLDLFQEAQPTSLPMHSISGRSQRRRARLRGTALRQVPTPSEPLDANGPGPDCLRLRWALVAETRRSRSDSGSPVRRPPLPSTSNR